MLISFSNIPILFTCPASCVFLCNSFFALSSQEGTKEEKRQRGVCIVRAAVQLYWLVLCCSTVDVVLHTSKQVNNNLQPTKVHCGDSHYHVSSWQCEIKWPTLNLRNTMLT